MSGSTVINVMSVVFTITTLAVFLFPIVRLAPSWLERSLDKKIAFHRAALAALGTAMARAHNDPDHLARLTVQHDWHRAALATLAPDIGSVAAPPAKRDAA